MKRLSSLWVSLSIISCLTSNNVVFAGDVRVSQVVRVDLDETIVRALDTSEELKIKSSQVNKSEGVYRETRSALLPHITGDSIWIYDIYSPEAVHMGDYFNISGVTASQVIWSFGKVMYAVDASKKMVEASRFNKEAGRQEIIYTAKLSYYSDLLARNALFITEKSYANALENKKLLGQRSYGGRNSKYETIKMNADVASRVPAVNEARTQFAAATETLKKIIDVTPDSAIELVGNFREKYEDLEYDALVAAMYDREPSLKSLDKAIDSADSKVKSRYASFLPTVSGFTSWDYVGGADNSLLRGNERGNYTFAGFRISVPIWEGGEKEAQLSQAKADKEITLLRRKQVNKELLLELKKASLEYEQHKENLKANNEAVALAEEAFTQAQEMFASGQVTLNDLNDAELLLTNQRLNKEMTLFNINITLARIERLIAGQWEAGQR